MRKLEMDAFESQADKTILANFPKAVKKRINVYAYEQGEFIQNAGNPMSHLFYILSGKAKIVLNQENGKSTILQFLTSDDFIGELTLVGAEQETKDVVSIGKTICLAIPLYNSKEVLMNDVVFLQTISQYIAKKLLKRMEHFSKSQTYELKYRLADVILLTSIDGVYYEKQIEIAEYLGVSYRHLLHTMRFFRENDYIMKQGNGFKVNTSKLLELLENGNR